ncbi:hypothetical protein KQX54_013031 [Cotesia glomerata]|uniref:Uncharacterized protein n=1 Tax=Cotesia glomerata TaxID=32391 RepID=A0AAV7J3R4_COTGL|nr:hypothetical protein KQX54_013031 [Cotesia glomerata]
MVSRNNSRLCFMLPVWFINQRNKQYTDMARACTKIPGALWYPSISFIRNIIAVYVDVDVDLDEHTNFVESILPVRGGGSPGDVEGIAVKFDPVALFPGSQGYYTTIRHASELPHPHGYTILLGFLLFIFLIVIHAFPPH